jgi:hypothetical protein
VLRGEREWGGGFGIALGGSSWQAAARSWWAALFRSGDGDTDVWAPQPLCQV